MRLPLSGIIVLEFTQYLSGPCAGLRLADLGARVIKIEHPVKGEAGRKLAIKNLWVDDNSLLFHTINRNKESCTVDLDDAEDMVLIKKLIAKADVLLNNFRPGVMKRKGLDYNTVKKINATIIYTQISGYGNEGPLKGKPGQDLLAQSLSGLTYTTGSLHDNPTPFGLGIGDYLCGNQAVQFILAALIRRKQKGVGALLELSLMESLLDLQFEFFTTLFESKQMPLRAAVNSGHALLSAPYGIYKTLDGFLAVAMMPLRKLNLALDCKALDSFAEEDAFGKRDEIKKVIADHIATKLSSYWLTRAGAFDLWIMPVLNWAEMKNTGGYQQVMMEQPVILNTGKAFITTRCPIRINKQKLLSQKPAPGLGCDNQRIKSMLYHEK